MEPLHRSTAKVLPRAHQAQAQALIDELLKSGVIIEEDKPSAWCPKGKFVEKKIVNGIPRLRLVTDYKKLNDSIARPVHGFPHHR